MRLPRRDMSGQSFEDEQLWADLLVATCRFCRFTRGRNVSGEQLKARSTS